MNLLEKNNDQLGYITVREFCRRSGQIHSFQKGLEVKSKIFGVKGAVIGKSELASRDELLKASDFWAVFREEIEKVSVEDEKAVLLYSTSRV